MRYEYLLHWSPDSQSPQCLRVARQRIRWDDHQPEQIARYFEVLQRSPTGGAIGAPRTGADEYDYNVVQQLLDEDYEIYTEPYSGSEPPVVQPVSQPGWFFLQAPEGRAFAHAVIDCFPGEEPVKRMNKGNVARAGWITFFTDGYGEPPLWVSLPQQKFECRTRRARAIYGYLYPGAALVVKGYLRRDSQVAVSDYPGIQVFPGLDDTYRV